MRLPNRRTAERSETILVVEDTADLRRMICQILAQNGYTVLEASNGLEALEISGTYREPIHLVLTDVVMPKMDGGELAERLRQLNPGQRLVFMSGYADDALVRRVERMAKFLAKPFTSMTLVRTIREVLDSPSHAGA
jgi:two-component system cell cycle sensor histidine kinase/response regulator CckA